MGKAPNAALKEAPPDQSTEWLNPDHPCRGVNRIVDAEAGRVDLLGPDGEEPRRKFALIGFSSATRGHAPLGNPEWAVVGMNQLQRHLRHHVFDENGEPVLTSGGEPATVLRHGDVWFEMHREWNTAVVPGTDHAAWLRDCGIPTYMTDIVDDIPTSVRYPVERLIDKFGLDYFTSTVAYMFAWAIDHIDRLVGERLRDLPRNGESAVDVMELVFSLYSEYTIGVFGIDLIVGEEYTWERPCAEFWLGQALARNISVLVPKESALLHQRYRYGYQMEPDDLVRDSDMDNRRKALEKQHAEAHDRSVSLYGRLAELNDLPQGEHALAERVKELTEEHQAASHEAVQLKGSLAELRYWREFRQLRERGGALGEKR